MDRWWLSDFLLAYLLCFEYAEMVYMGFEFSFKVVMLRWFRYLYIMNYIIWRGGKILNENSWLCFKLVNGSAVWHIVVHDVNLDGHVAKSIAEVWRLCYDLSTFFFFFFFKLYFWFYNSKAVMCQFQWSRNSQRILWFCLIVVSQVLENLMRNAE